MKKSNVIKLAITAAVLILIPKRSSPQADNINNVKRANEKQKELNDNDN